MKRLFAAIAVLMFAAAGCGQSGPLYIPGNPSKIQNPPPAAEEPAEEEQADDNGDSDKG